MLDLKESNQLPELQRVWVSYKSIQMLFCRIDQHRAFASSFSVMVGLKHSRACFMGSGTLEGSHAWFKALLLPS